MEYKELRQHVGHNIEINDVTDWQSNLEIGIEIRCIDCETEPLFEIDNPEVVRDGDTYKLK